MARLDPQVAAHLEWLGFVRPTGLVVSAPALVRAGVILNRRDSESQRQLRDCLVADPDKESSIQATPLLGDFREFAESVLGWRFSPKGYAGTPEVPIPAELMAPLPESDGAYGPDFAVRAEPLGSSSVQPPEADGVARESPPWQLLVSIIDPGQGFDDASSGDLDLSAHRRMERLLRHTRVSAGLIFNGAALRLVSAPAGENSGWMDFQVADMTQAAGKPICSAMRELLCEVRLLAVPADKRLAALLHDSRKFQNEVSERLAEQVLHALYELLRGFQAAHDASNGELLGHLLTDDPDEIYRGLLTVVLRLVFLLYAEERDMLPQGEVFQSAYSVSALYERLREDAAIYPDTMDQRYGSYAQLLALWRMVHDGAHGPNLNLSPRHGDLFHPDRYPFLEGRGGSHGDVRQVVERIDPPLVSDGTIHRVLAKLIVLDAERISYRALDVEHIGSVYETMMGFRLERAAGRSIAVKAAKKYGAPATINLEELLTEVPSKRAKWFKDRTDRKLNPTAARAVQRVDKQAGGTVDELHAALESVVDKSATPDLVPPGAMVLQPSEERRRSGSHYTPRELTEPIVRVALEPIFNRLRSESDGPPTAEQLLDLKVCDPAMGSGAFLVEACRQLGDALMEAWRTHGAPPDLSRYEDEAAYARRLIAQRCLYGVDRNPKAVDLAKLSLWLATLAQDHPLTFLDHALRHGDSLVGLSLPQLQAFHWKGHESAFEDGFETLKGREHLTAATALRQLIREADAQVTDSELRELWYCVQQETDSVRQIGDLTVAAFFTGRSPKEREAIRSELAISVVDGDIEEYRVWLNDLRYSDPPVASFHWLIEFPEVFDRENPGFDSVIGNPPFAGKNTLRSSNAQGYSDWLKHAYPGSHGAADLVAFFFRRTYELTRLNGSVGLVATNTIAQGDTRHTGLRWICTNGGTIYNALRRITWPGQASVVISVVHLVKGDSTAIPMLDAKPIPSISAYLVAGNQHEDPPRLSANAQKSFQGDILRGMGFTFDERHEQSAAAPLSLMYETIDQNPDSIEVILPYIGGEELNKSPLHRHRRYAIDLNDYEIDECRERWPEVTRIVEARVRPERLALSDSKSNSTDRARWWCYSAYRREMRRAIEGLDRVIANSRVCQRLQYTFLPTNMVYADSLVVYPFETFSAFCVLQSRIHEVWARNFGSSMRDDLRYTPSDCFETFPFPTSWTARDDFEAAGDQYHTFRANLMTKGGQGMTATYNRFHDPYADDVNISQLRQLHDVMDRVVLNAYGWDDIPIDCEFLLDRGIYEQSNSGTKRSYRLRWPDDICDELLARLLDLSGSRHTKDGVANISPASRRAKEALEISSGGGDSLITLWDS